MGDVGKGQIGNADMHFETYFYGAVQFGLPEQVGLWSFPGCFPRHVQCCLPRTSYVVCCPGTCHAGRARGSTTRSST